MTRRCVAALGAALALLTALASAGPVLAGSLVAYPSTVEMTVLPGTTGRVILSIENRLNRTCTVTFSRVTPQALEPGYVNLPDASWLTLDTVTTRVLSEERAWTAAEIAVPDDNRLRGQKWQIEVAATCQEEPLLGAEYWILLTVGSSTRQRTSWWVAGGIIAGGLAGAVAWSRWRNACWSAWPTGLRAGDWGQRVRGA
jgi:hypothetical protein